MKSIKEKTKEWTSENKRAWALAIVVLLITLSFGLGYLAGKESGAAPIIIEQSTGSSTRE